MFDKKMYKKISFSPEEKNAIGEPVKSAILHKCFHRCWDLEHDVPVNSGIIGLGRV